MYNDSDAIDDIMLQGKLCIICISRNYKYILYTYNFVITHDR